MHPAGSAASVAGAGPLRPQAGCGLTDERPAGLAGVPLAAPPARSAPAVSASGAEIRTGMAVFHTKFGEGTVLAIEGQGADARAQVDFRRHGTKWLALAVAKLTPVS